jgi:hypothetical protein
VSFVHPRARERYDLEAISVWLEGALPPALVGPPTPWAYIAELESEVRAARLMQLEILAATLRAVLAECS